MRVQGQTAMAPRRQARGDRARAIGRLAVVLVVAAVVMTGTAPARAALYKWVDEKGVVHYTDKIPPEAVDKASVELNPQGVPVKKTDKALTPEQRRAMAEEEERRRQIARQQEEVARRDRALVSSYTSEAEIDLARKRALQTIDAAVQSSLAFSEQLTKRKADAEAKKVEFQGKPIVLTLERELESIEAELARQVDLVAHKRREAAAVIAKYDADKQRWRELVAAKSTPVADSNAAPPATRPPAAKK